MFFFKILFFNVEKKIPLVMFYLKCLASYIMTIRLSSLLSNSNFAICISKLISCVLFEFSGLLSLFSKCVIRMFKSLLNFFNSLAFILEYLLVSKQILYLISSHKACGLKRWFKSIAFLSLLLYCLYIAHHLKVEQRICHFGDSVLISILNMKSIGKSSIDFS